MKIITEITLDLSRQGVQASVPINQHDAGARRLLFHLRNGGKPIKLEATDTAVLYIAGDRFEPLVVYTEDGAYPNSIVYDISPNASAQAGEFLAQIQIYKAVENITFTPKFMLLVSEDDTNSSGVLSSPQYAAVIKAQLAAEQYSKEAEGFAKSAEEKVGSAEEAADRAEEASQNAGTSAARAEEEANRAEEAAERAEEAADNMGESNGPFEETNDAIILESEKTIRFGTPSAIANALGLMVGGNGYNKWVAGSGPLCFGYDWNLTRFGIGEGTGDKPFRFTQRNQGNIDIGVPELKTLLSFILGNLDAVNQPYPITLNSYETIDIYADYKDIRITRDGDDHFIIGTDKSEWSTAYNPILLTVGGSGNGVRIGDGTITLISSGGADEVTLDYSELSALKDLAEKYINNEI